MGWWEKVLDWVYGKECIFCGKEGVWLCEKCRWSLRLADGRCPVCGKESKGGWRHKECEEKWEMDGLSVIWDYGEKKVKKLIWEMKYGFNRDLIREVVRGCSFELGGEWDGVVVIPLHWQRENWRGFNQARVIGEEMGEKLGLEVKEVLARKRKTKQQAGIRGRKERRKNVEGVFEVKEEEKKWLKRKRLLLVDDVFTSGATMREVTKVLKKVGVEKVWGVVLAG